MREAQLNEEADQIADKSLEQLRGLNLMHLARYLKVRHNNYVEFLKGIHHVIARTYIKANNIRTAPAFQACLAQPKEYTTFAHLYYLDAPIQGAKLKLKVTQAMTHKYLSTLPNYMWGFLGVLRNHSMSQSGIIPGTTWLELLILSLCHCNDIIAIVFPSTNPTAKGNPATVPGMYG